MKLCNTVLDNLRLGNKKALDEIYNTYHNKIYYFCLNHYHSKEESEEVVQEVFLKIWVNRNNINNYDTFESYLFTIAKNIISNNIKKKIYSKAYQDYCYNQNNFKSNTTENEVIFNDFEQLYHQALKELPEKRRQIFIMSRTEGLTYKEIADRLNISIKTVETHMQLSLKYFKGVLKARTDIIVSLILFFSLHP